MTKFSVWLDKDDFSIPLLLEESYLEPLPQVSGRPTKPFSSSSDKSKRRKIAHLLDTGAEELTFAAKTALYDSGQRIAANVLKEATATPNAALMMRNKMSQNSKCKAQQFSPEEALAILIDCDLSKDTYIYLRKCALDKGHDLFPPYHTVQDAKKNCCVTENNSVTVGETRAEVSLQALVDHTAQRLAIVQQPVLQKAVEDGKSNFELIFKWGCDGSGGHSEYKQKFTDDDGSMTDEFVFMYSLVPLQFRFEVVDSNSSCVVWQNYTSGSPRFCRPIKYMF